MGIVYCSRMNDLGPPGSKCRNQRVILSARDQLREDTRFRILRLLQNDPELSQRNLARALGVSTGNLNFLLNALIQKGFVKLGNFSAAQDKRRYAYILTPRGISEKAALTARFLRRKQAEYDALRAEIETLQDEIAHLQAKNGAALP